MKVAILHYAAPPVVGGVEKTIRYQARLLAQAGQQVRVIAGRGEPFHTQVSFRRLPELDSRHRQVLAVGRALAEGKVSAAFSRLRDRLVDQLRPLLVETEVLIAHNAVTLHKNLPLTAALHELAQEGHTPLIAWCHDMAWCDPLYAAQLHPGYPWDLLRTPWPGVRYVAVSAHRRALLAELLGVSEEAIQVVSPGVDVVTFLKLEPATQHLVQQFDLLSADPLMLLPARITRRKNVEFAMQVMAHLMVRRPGAALVVTGPPGPHNPANAAYLASLRALREELGLAGRVHLLYEAGEEGEPLYVTDAMMADLYHLADLLLFPSHREGFGIPLLEAGLARLPVFAARIPPLQETAAGWAHLFDPQGDPDAVAAEIAAHVSSDNAYQMRRRVLERYTWEAAVQRDLLPLLQEVATSVRQ